MEKSELKRIIKEEISKTLSEERMSLPSPTSQQLWDTNAYDIIIFLEKIRGQVFEYSISPKDVCIALAEVCMELSKGSNYKDSYNNFNK